MNQRALNLLFLEKNQLIYKIDDIPKKKSRNDASRFGDEIVAMFGELLEYSCITPIQHKKNFLNFI